MFHSQPPSSLTINLSGMNDLSEVILPPMYFPITSAAWTSHLVTISQCCYRLLPHKHLQVKSGGCSYTS